MPNVLMDIYEDRHTKCYWCGQPPVGHEHVPPQNLFPNGHRIDLLTVGSCLEHNQNFSKLDERLRFLLTTSSKSELAKQHFITKSAKGIVRPESQKLATEFVSNYIHDYDGKNMFKENVRNFDLYFEKIIRGLYFYHFGVNHNGATSFFSNKIQQFDMYAEAHFYYYTVANEFTSLWKNGASKNPDIFEYKYYRSNEDDRFFVSMNFYTHHNVIGMTIPPNKTINDYCISYEELLERQKHWDI